MSAWATVVAREMAELRRQLMEIALEQTDNDEARATTLVDAWMRGYLTQGWKYERGQ